MGVKEGIDLDDITQANILALETDKSNPLADPYYPYGDNCNETETNYIRDTQLEGNYVLRHSSGAVWVASRLVKHEVANSVALGSFNVRSLGSTGYLDSYDLCFGSSSDGASYSYARQSGVRPIIILESGIKIVKGEQDGKTAGTAYILTK